MGWRCVGCSHLHEARHVYDTVCAACGAERYPTDDYDLIPPNYTGPGVFHGRPSVPPPPPTLVSVTPRVGDDPVLRWSSPSLPPLEATPPVASPRHGRRRGRRRGFPRFLAVSLVFAGSVTAVMLLFAIPFTLWMRQRHEAPAKLVVATWEHATVTRHRADTQVEMFPFQASNDMWPVSGCASPFHRCLYQVPGWVVTSKTVKSGSGLSRPPPPAPTTDPKDEVTIDSTYVITVAYGGQKRTFTVDGTRMDLTEAESLRSRYDALVGQTSVTVSVDRLEIPRAIRLPD